jgi:hypothetical protein
VTLKVGSGSVSSIVVFIIHTVIENSRSDQFTCLREALTRLPRLKHAPKHNCCSKNQRHKRRMI